MLKKIFGSLVVAKRVEVCESYIPVACRFYKWWKIVHYFWQWLWITGRSSGGVWWLLCSSSACSRMSSVGGPTMSRLNCFFLNDSRMCATVFRGLYRWCLTGSACSQSCGSSRSDNELVILIKVKVHEKHCQLVPSVFLVKSTIEGCIFFTARHKWKKW